MARDSHESGAAAVAEKNRRGVQPWDTLLEEDRAVLVRLVLIYQRCELHATRRASRFSQPRAVARQSARIERKLRYGKAVGASNFGNATRVACGVQYVPWITPELATTREVVDQVGFVFKPAGIEEGSSRLNSLK